MPGWSRRYNATYVQATETLEGLVPSGAVNPMAAYMQYDVQYAGDTETRLLNITDGTIGGVSYVFDAIPWGEKLPRAILCRISIVLNAFASFSSVTVTPISFPGEAEEYSQDSVSLTKGTVPAGLVTFAETVRVLGVASNGDCRIDSNLNGILGVTVTVRVQRLGLLY